jgi:hypothetical protein
MLIEGLELVGFIGRESHRNKWKILNLRERGSRSHGTVRFVEKLCGGIITCVPIN